MYIYLKIFLVSSSPTVREEPEPTVQFESTQPTGVTIYEEELNVVNTDVVVNFNEPNTDPTVAGVDLWQMQLWFSKADNGLGSSIGTIESALSEEQADQPVSFTDFSFEVGGFARLFPVFFVRAESVLYTAMALGTLWSSPKI